MADDFYKQYFEGRTPTQNPVTGKKEEGINWIFWWLVVMVLIQAAGLI